MTVTVLRATEEDPWVRTSYADYCLECLEHLVEPEVETTLTREVLCTYVCPCGHRWHTRWNRGLPTPMPAKLSPGDVIHLRALDRARAERPTKREDGAA